MKMILLLALVVVFLLVRPMAASDSLLARLDGPTCLWLAVSLLAISSMGGDREASKARKQPITSLNPLSDSSFSGSRSFLSPGHSL